MRDFAPDTKRHSLVAINRFEQLSGMDAEKFLAFAKTHDSVETLDIIKKIRDNFDNSVAVNFENHMRSFLKHNGVMSLPTSKNSYVPKDWHRGYNRQELGRLLGYLSRKHHKLYAYVAIESGLRAQTILDIRYRHIQQDLGAGVVPIAIRFEPKFYSGSKAAGFTFLGEHSIKLLREMIDQKLIKEEKDSPIIVGEPEGSVKLNKHKQWKKKKDSALTYASIQLAIRLAARKAGVDRKVQVTHGFRKYFENALDAAGLDHDKKRLIEGHLGDVRSKHYTGREWDELRPLYRKAYPNIDFETDPVLRESVQDWQFEKTELKRRIGRLENERHQLENERHQWFENLLKAVIAWGSETKPTQKQARKFAEFLLEYAPDLNENVKKRSSAKA